MFRDTKLKLITLNAAVFFVLISIMAIGSYIYVRDQLMLKADSALPTASEASALGGIGTPILQEAVPSQRSALRIGGVRATYAFRIDMTDRMIYTLFWDADGELIDKPLPDEINKDLLAKLRKRLTDKEPFTVESNGKTFRVKSVAERLVLTDRAQTTATVESYTVQYMTNITEESTMLRNLLTLLLSGIVAAGIVAVTAGWYLASRALVPIRTAWDRQQQFVADASHELRTPLSVIQAHSELLLRHPERTIEEESRSVSTVLREGRRMRRLVDGLLMLARADSNTAELMKAPLRIDEALRAAVEQMEPLAAARHIVLRYASMSAAECPADEERIHQLFLIVLDNAVKYTPEGGIVSLSCSKLQGTVRIAVEDTGVGIAPDDLPHVFERFYRSDKVRTREQGGIGLGLAIARWIVESHGGTIRAESRYGVGTTIHIQLPA